MTEPLKQAPASEQEWPKEWLEAVTEVLETHNSRFESTSEWAKRLLDSLNDVGALRPPARVDGYVLVPEIPTPEMWEAYFKALEHPTDETKEPWHKLKGLKRWKAMLDAAPHHTAVTSAGVDTVGHTNLPLIPPAFGPVTESMVEAAYNAASDHLHNKATMRAALIAASAASAAQMQK